MYTLVSDKEWGELHPICMLTLFCERMLSVCILIPLGIKHCNGWG